MQVKLQRRADDLPDQVVDCEKVTVTLRDDVRTEEQEIVVEHDLQSGEYGELRVIIDDECVYSWLFGPPPEHPITA